MTGSMSLARIHRESLALCGPNIEAISFADGGQVEYQNCTNQAVHESLRGTFRTDTRRKNIISAGVKTRTQLSKRNAHASRTQPFTLDQIADETRHAIATNRRRLPVRLEQ